MIATRWLPAYMHMIISHRLIFCYVPKVACSNWKLTLRRAAGLPDLEQKSLIHLRRESGLDYLSNHNALVRLYYLNNPAYRRAVFVRNPWTRVLSAYRNTIEYVHKTDPTQHLIIRPNAWTKWVVSTHERSNC